MPRSSPSLVACRANAVKFAPKVANNNCLPWSLNAGNQVLKLAAVGNKVSIYPTHQPADDDEAATAGAEGFAPTIKSHSMIAISPS